MKIRFGMLMTDARGKSGGQVASKNKAGAYIRRISMPSNPSTVEQQTARSAFATVASGWSALDDDQRAAWNSYSGSRDFLNVWGESYKASGKQCYQSCNSALLNTNQPLISTPPTQAAPSAIILTSFDINVDDEEFDITFDGSLSARATLVVEATAPLSAGTYNAKSKFAKIFTKAGTTAPTASELWNAYVAKYGEPVEGKSIQIQVYKVSEQGLMSARSSQRAIVPAASV